MDPSALASLSPADLRALLPRFLSGFIVDEGAARQNAERVQAFVSDWDDPTCARVAHLLATIGEEQRVYPADPACRLLARVWSQDVILQPRLEGVDHLREAMQSGPAVVLCNHLSYFDSTAIDAILAWEGHEDLADRLMSAAGPKVYQALFRRVAASCLNTLPVPQSTTFSHTEPLSPRELARRAITSLRLAQKGAEDGLVLLIYPEGSRSRSGRMGSFLKAVRRYLEIADPLFVVPAAICGTHRIMPVDDERMHPTHASLHFGPAVRVGGDLDARNALAEAHAAIGRLLPEDHRPDPEAPPVA